jgi:hypothetical protein
MSYVRQIEHSQDMKNYQAGLYDTISHCFERLHQFLDHSNKTHSFDNHMRRATFYTDLKVAKKLNHVRVYSINMAFCEVLNVTHWI